ncbi:hypothetical protein BDV32DRAFT_126762 [Aspergillus pseudonomiae]|uniref:Uncharacterized protein n=1 Tax=Aspergillus pseudonomiae TaxID=1506151 RepID=A0A5N6HTK2_9EURO|nr:uncharacterized protein BDV37DRAFT_258874 [Aspergillus pseudonomiae]KAB8257822.1 hypothetical protein BDV32DRAFT_126762 [Aspergillus pseudonomiae]KAE8399959.1 hypothetical protein BDV37DRAFT_258874 [Aspergillus pseudonomiae]
MDKKEGEAKFLFSCLPLKRHGERERGRVVREPREQQRGMIGRKREWIGCAVGPNVESRRTADWRKRQWLQPWR